MNMRHAAAFVLGATSLAVTLAGAAASAGVRAARLVPRAAAIVPNQGPTPNVYVGINPDNGSSSGVFSYLDDGNYLTALLNLSTYGIALDAAGNLYVGTDNYPQGIYVYPPLLQGAPPAPVLYLDDRGFDPYGIVVEKNGTVIVANECVDVLGGMPPCSTPGSIVAYKRGATRPYVTYANPSTEFFPTYVTADHEGSVYADEPNGGPVYEWTSPKRVRALPLVSKRPSGLLTDAADNLVVADAYPATSSSVEVFAHKTFALLRSFPTGANAAGVQIISLDQSNSTLYAAQYDTTGSCGSGPSVDFYAYQSGTPIGCFNPHGVSLGVFALAANPEAIP